MTKPPKKRIAMFLSCDSFEKFFGGTFGLTRDEYLLTYRNDFSWTYAEGLHRLGHEVILYVLSYGPPDLRDASEGVLVRFLPLPRWLRWADRVMYRLMSFPGGALMRDRLAYLGYRESLRQALAEDKVEIFYVQEFWTARFSILLEDLDLPVIGADHGAKYDATLMTRHRKLFRNAALLICQTEENFDRVRKVGGKAALLSNAVDTRFFTPPAISGARSRTILAVGRLVEEQKRFSDIVKALVRLSNFSLSLVGSGPSEPELRALARELGVADRVHFLGFVSDRLHIRQLYQQCGVFVSSSAWEALALVLLEAMSCAGSRSGDPYPRLRGSDFRRLFRQARQCR